MEIKQLEIFVSVARNRSFSRAAESLYISQPTVSTSIHALEFYLGVQLLIRNTKEVSLTKAGLEFLTYAQNILALRDQALCALRGEDRAAAGSIDIISSTVPAQHLLPELIASFRRERPHIVFRIDQADSRWVEQEMSGFRYDFGLVGTAPENARLLYDPIYNDELVLILPRQEERSSEYIRENVAAYLLEMPFIMRESGSGTRAEVEALLSKLGVPLTELRIVAYFSDAQGILQAVSHGMGISLVSKIAAAMYLKLGLLRVVEMNQPLFHRQIFLLHNRELHFSPLQQAFADHARSFYL